MAGTHTQRVLAVCLVGAAVGALVSLESEAWLRLAQATFMGGLLWLKAAP